MDQEDFSKKAYEVGKNIRNLMEKTELKMKLAEMETKSTFESFHKLFGKMKQKVHNKNCEVKNLSDEARLKWHLGIMEAKESWDNVKVEYKKMMKEIKPHLDHAKLKAHLGKMDSVDYLSDKKKGGKRPIMKA